MARKRSGPALLSAGMPWWVRVALAAGFWVGIVFVLPHGAAELPIVGRHLGIVLERLAWVPATVVAALLLLWTAASRRDRRRKRRLLDTREGIASIRKLSWREFEELVAEAFRREGYSVVENEKAGADGGVDIRLRRNGGLYLVQCKHWNRNRVGVGVIREMCGVMMDEGAAGVVIVCSGRFTRNAWAFARGKPVRLVDGRALVRMVERLKEKGGSSR